jgi:hypothetical protein
MLKKKMYWSRMGFRPWIFARGNLKRKATDENKAAQLDSGINGTFRH